MHSVCTAVSGLICKHTEKENGLQDLMEIMLDSLMCSQAEATGWPTEKPYSNSPRLKTRMKKAGYSPANKLLLLTSVH